MAQLIDLSGATLPRQLVSANGQIVLLPPYITVEEKHSDTAVITQHPVDSGAVMSDHIYLLPPELMLTLGWSNADTTATGTTYVRDTYATLLQLKNARQLFTAYSGKRLYDNIGVESIEVDTDAKLEFAMIAQIRLKQLLLVQTATTTGAPTAVQAATNPNPANQANAQATQPTQAVGTAQVTQTTINSDVLLQQNSTGSDAADQLQPLMLEDVQTNSNNGGAGPNVSAPGIN